VVSVSKSSLKIFIANGESVPPVSIL